ncbi:MAG TPA: hypothetical protein VFE54_03340 [Mucilaginibacter sp.]|jgi:hypothetical protein|nr:hypothetical protein [Mucilaginibacter sp.]
MIEKTLKTTDGKIRVRIPTVLNEITIGQMMAMQEKRHLDDMDAISILSGVPKEDLYTVRNINDFQVFGDYVISLSQQIAYLYNSDIVPHRITFTLNDTKVTVGVLRNLSVEPAGAFLAARDIIADEINEHINLYGEEDWKEHFQPSLKSCCQVLAHYFFCRATGKRYDEYEAEEFCEEIKKLRVTEALPIAKHFFSCYPNLLKQRISFSQRLRQYWRGKLVSRRLKSSNISIQ